jgi:hypothetical protein
VRFDARTKCFDTSFVSVYGNWLVAALALLRVMFYHSIAELDKAVNRNLSKYVYSQVVYRVQLDVVRFPCYFICFIQLDRRLHLRKSYLWL